MRTNKMAAIVPPRSKCWPTEYRNDEALPLSPRLTLYFLVMAANADFASRSLIPW
jgi:hypothetical protein